MKKALIMALALVMVFILATGCTSNGAPEQTQAPTANPPAATDAAGTTSPGGAALSIPGFAEGTEVDIGELPEIKTALQEVHEGATITRVTHATYETQQTYCVEYTDQDGVVRQAYVLPSGSIVMDGAMEPATGTDAGQSGESGAAGGTSGGSGSGTGGSGGSGSGAGGSTGGTGAAGGAGGSGNTTGGM